MSFNLPEGAANNTAAPYNQSTEELRFDCYICPNQFDGNDDASERAALGKHVDEIIDAETAIEVAKRLADLVGHRVVVDKRIDQGGHYKWVKHATVLISGRVVYH